MHHHSNTNISNNNFSANLNGIQIMEAAPIIKLWVLRILVPLGMHRDFISKHEFEDNNLARFIGLGHWIGSKGYKRSTIRQELRELHKAAENNAMQQTIPKRLSQNSKKLAKTMGLSATDCRILEFIVLIQLENLLAKAVEMINDDLNALRVYKALSVILAISEKDIRKSLSIKSILRNSGLVSMRFYNYNSLKDNFELLSSNFAETVYFNDAEPLQFLGDLVEKSTELELKMGDFQHIDKELLILMPFLSKSLKNRRTGVNFYIHGKPGTGKTQLVKAIASKLGYELYEISSENNEGDAIKGTTRLRAFRLAQNILKNQKVMLLFDEVEDIFSDGGFFGRSTAEKSKAWINRMLENNEIPSFWLSNEISSLDAAFIRRYDMVFELPVPPKKQREKIIRDIGADFLSEQLIEQMSESENLAPAIVSRAGSVVQYIQDDLDAEKANAAFELLINHTLENQGHRTIKAHDPKRLPGNYSPEFINADASINDLVAGLKQNKSARICIYGPPGTGKTAYTRWLAQQLDMPLVVKRGSDIHSKWVGGTEKNIANVFKQAEADNALLLIDEVEGFLQDRRNASKSWETSEVNEMLTQMESFSGIFMASTNLLNTLDQAAFRRFDLKMKFDYLLPEQAWRLFKSYCKELKLPCSPKKHLPTVERLDKLTPGDFAVIFRRNRFKPLKTADEMMAVLQNEIELKGGESLGRVGFV